ncbi:MAG: phosphoribosyltransferase, partial [Proteobacteria bacterium]|nr:phosphoribosyltransferase [Pseudomonadota bacterium]
MTDGPEILFSSEEIAARVTELAREIAGAPQRPDIAMPILVGGFVFAADL